MPRFSEFIAKRKGSKPPFVPIAGRWMMYGSHPDLEKGYSRVSYQVLPHSNGNKYVVRHVKRDAMEEDSLVGKHIKTTLFRHYYSPVPDEEARRALEEFKKRKYI